MILGEDKHSFDIFSRCCLLRQRNEMVHGTFHNCVSNETFNKFTITLQETRTRSRRPKVLIPHPPDKQEEEKAAAGTGKQGRTSKRATTIRQGRQQWKTNKTQQRCSLSIRRISLLHPPAAGGERLPSRSQTTSVLTLPSGESKFLINISLYYRFSWRAAH